jgi:hypothetical protein
VQSARSTRELRSDTQISRVAFWPTRTPPVEGPRPACRAQSSLPGTLGSRRAGCPGPFPWLAPGWQRRVTGILQGTTFAASSLYTEDGIQKWVKVPIHILLCQLRKSRTKQLSTARLSTKAAFRVPRHCA